MPPRVTTVILSPRIADRGGGRLLRRRRRRDDRVRLDGRHGGRGPPGASRRPDRRRARRAGRDRGRHPRRASARRHDHHPGDRSGRGHGRGRRRPARRRDRRLAGHRGPVVPTFERETVYGSPDATQLDALGPVFLGFFAYFFVFLLTGVSFLRERTGGTLERLLATPVARGRDRRRLRGRVRHPRHDPGDRAADVLPGRRAGARRSGRSAAFSLGLGVAERGQPPARLRSSSCCSPSAPSTWGSCSPRSPGPSSR